MSVGFFGFSFIVCCVGWLVGGCDDFSLIWIWGMMVLFLCFNVALYFGWISNRYITWNFECYVRRILRSGNGLWRLIFKNSNSRNSSKLIIRSLEDGMGIGLDMWSDIIYILDCMLWLFEFIHCITISNFMPIWLIILVF